VPRIKLSEQRFYEFQAQFQVEPQHINDGGHLGNDSLISLVGDARAHLFHTLGLSELNLGYGQTGIIIADLIVNYKAEAFLSDQLLIETHVGEIMKKGFRIFHRVTRGSKLIALVETGCVTYDYREKKPASIPDGFLKRFPYQPRE
jgi:acyl-CoA thioester hydrolase